MKDRAFRIVGIVVAAVLVVALAVVVVIRVRPGSTKPGTSAAPPTAATQLAWFIGATHDMPVSEAVLARHVTPSYLDAVGGSVGFEEEFEPLGPMTLVSSRPTGEDTTIWATASADDGSGRPTTYLTALSVNGDGLIAHLEWSVRLPPPTSWSQVDHRLHSLAPRVSFVTDRIDPGGRCRVVHGLNATTPRPLGSSFKLYVLGALARAVADHRARWNQRLAIRDAWKSYPSGTLQYRPAGTRLALRDYADRMISDSDNTATDHLIHLIGRDRVQRQLRLFDNDHAAMDIPFPTTREVLSLKGIHYPRLADRYVAASPAGRLRILDRADHLPRSQVSFGTKPRDIDSIEWFASPTDVCHAYAGLWEQSRHARLAPVGEALSINDGSLLVNSEDYPVTWFKGGSELGVLTESYLVRGRDGSVIVTSMMLSDARHIFDEGALVPRVLAIIRGSLRLADPRVGSTG